MLQKVVYQLSARQILLIAFASALIAAGTVACVSGYGNLWNSGNQANKVYAEDAPADISNPSAVSDEQNSIEVYKSLSPGVAFITSTSLRQDYYGEVQEGKGSGSGSVIDNQGHILTNYHVVEGAQRLSVSLGGGKAYPAKYIGGDPDTDLAVIKIDAPATGLTIVPLGDSDKLSVGQKVLAIGNPFGLDRTLTTGVISGLQRPIRSRPVAGAPTGRPIDAAIQTDASINPGNSGGPLLDKLGRMIGINSQILSPGGGSVGVGFAVPVNTAKRVIPQILQYGEVRRPKIGAGLLSVEDLKERGLQLPIESGLLIRNTQPGGSAQRAGLRGLTQEASGEVVIGDIITAIDGEKISDLDGLYRFLDKKQFGDTVQVEILRNGTTQTVPLRLTQDTPTRGTTRIQE
jgi:S1-C subfamily serine protease